MKRRQFLWVGATTLATVAASPLTQIRRPSNRGDEGVAIPIKSNTPPNTETHADVYSFLLDVGTVTQINSQTMQVIEQSPWTFPKSFRDPSPSKLMDDVSSMTHILDMAANHLSSSKTQGYPDSAEAFLDFHPNGLPDLTNISGPVVCSLQDRKAINLALDFGQRQPGSDQSSSAPGASLISPNSSFAAQGAMLSTTAFGWRFQFRGPDTHPLGWCEARNVTHFNFEVFHQNRFGGFDYVLNFHLGALRDRGRRCFVLWQNEPAFPICWKQCTPSVSDLANGIKRVLVSAAAKINVRLWAWEASLIASIIASAIYIPVLLLA